MKNIQVCLSSLFYTNAFLTYVCKIALLKPVAWIIYILYFVNTYVLIYSCYKETRNFRKAVNKYVGDIMITTVPIAIYITIKVVQFFSSTLV